MALVQTISVSLQKLTMWIGMWKLVTHMFGLVTNAVDHVQSGTDALHTAKSLQKKSRKCMIISMVLLLIIALIIVLSILKPWKK
ncbi:putative target SNARE coiled-coil domain-containing protein [Rosa chinensis]|uniref:Putative target SNARE coiled-coil domain-containing protein n=1 Tax=Rosa chinensis TaxID=74649 RepID=A0A2P6S2D7_ROSCH|nr:putative target SNARE coiled-coil domain-containing protein [Rosa chinensis]